MKVRFHFRSKKKPFGRFGGGWNWKLGFQAGGRELIVSLLVFEIRVTFGKSKETYL